MIGSPIQRTVALLITVCLVTLPVAQTAQAAIIPTDTAIEIAYRHQQIDRINEVLARESVQSVMVQLGVDPVDASARVQSLTAEELQTLEENLAELPAGGTGVLEVVGIVAIVLIVLELLHVTNFFSEF
jgi:P pilus assembly chaperone PapD